MIDAGRLAALAANSNSDFLEDQDHQIKALRDIGAPPGCILPWIEDPARIPSFWESRILEISGPAEEEGPVNSMTVTTLDDIMFTVGDPNYTISGAFTSSVNFVPSAFSISIYHDGQVQGDAVETQLTTSGIAGGPADWTFSYTRPTTDLVAGDTLFVTVYGAFDGGADFPTNSLAALLTINPA